MNSRRSNTRRPLWPHYQYGFGNEFSSEALPGALPRHNNPHQCPYSLYAEQISGTPFTVPRHANKRTWMYRIRPSAVQGTVIPDTELARLLTDPEHVTPERLRWSPIPVTKPRDGPHTFVEGLITMAGAGDPADKNGAFLFPPFTLRPSNSVASSSVPSIPCLLLQAADVSDVLTRRSPW